MASTEEKFALVLEAVNLCLKQEFRGNLLSRFQPQASISLEKDPEESGSYDTSTDIVLKYPDGSIGEAVNWGGSGKSLDESLTANLWCLQFEIKMRMHDLEQMYKRLQAAAPTDEPIESDDENE